MSSEAERERVCALCRRDLDGRLGVGKRGTLQQLLGPRGVGVGGRKEKRQNAKINSFVELDV